MTVLSWKSAACAVALSLLGFGAHAATISFGGTTYDPYGTSDSNRNCNAACVAAIFGTSSTLTQSYKDEITAESGTLAGSYETVFSPNSEDASGFTITWTGGGAFTCPECYLVVKDGNQSPAQYFFSLANWNGTDTISGTGFWAGTQGGISHVAIYGTSVRNVPEPGTVALLGLGLLGIGVVRRRRA